MTADDVLAWVQTHHYADDDRHSIEDMAKFRVLVEEVHRLRALVNDSRASAVARLRDEVAALESELARERSPYQGGN
jgi:hypothetical protein